jgi:hypothetical protein
MGNWKDKGKYFFIKSFKLAEVVCNYDALSRGNNGNNGNNRNLLSGCAETRNTRSRVTTFQFTSHTLTC